MSGILHIFRTQPDLYQVNYTLGTASYARTCSREQLEHIMVTPAAFNDELIDNVFDELSKTENVTIADVAISENDATSLGFEPMPSDA